MVPRHFSAVNRWCCHGFSPCSFFIGYYETLWLNTFRECEINLHRRYVDDILCLFNCKSDADKFFEFLNTAF